MASSGSFNTNAYSDSEVTRYLTFSWSIESQSIVNNTTTIAWTLKGNGNPTSYWVKSGNFRVIIDGDTVYQSADRITLYGTTTVASGRKTLTHNSDGTRSFGASAQAGIYYSAVNCSGSGSWSLTQIPRYGTSVQSLESKTTVNIKMNWSSDNTVDYVWYSTDGGTNFTAVGAVNAKSGQYTITGLTPDTTYSIVTRIRRADSQLTTDSSALAITTDAAPIQTLASRTETSLTIDWTAPYTVNNVWYSINGGSSWINLGSVNATSGSYTITGLSDNTAYSIVTRVRIRGTTVTVDSVAGSFSTYSYPYATTMPNFTIGNQLTVKIFNPLGRTVSTTIIGANDAERTAANTVSGTSISGFNSSAWASFLYSTIPNAKTGTYKVKITYENHSETRTGGTYTINEANCQPVISSLTYADINSSTTAVTQNDQYIVQGKSTVRFTASGVAGTQSATIASVSLSVNNNSYSMTGSGTTYTGGNAAINSTKDVTATATVTDSRGVKTTKTCTVTVFGWAEPTALITIGRQAGFYDATDINVDALYSSIGGTNTVTITYRYRQQGTSSWSAAASLQDNVTSTFSIDNKHAFDVRVTVADGFGGTVTYTVVVPRGVPMVFFDAIKHAVGIGRFPESDDSLWIDGLDDDVVTEIKKTWVSGGRNYFKNSNDRTKWRSYTPTAYLVAQIDLTENLIAGETYVVSIWGDAPTRGDTQDTYYSLYWGGGSNRLYNEPGIQIVDGVGTGVFTVPQNMYSANEYINIYNTYPQADTTYNANITAVKIQRISSTPEWVPAPEDLTTPIHGTYTPAITWSAGTTITTANVAFRYSIVGKTIHIGGRFQITNLGEPYSENLQIALPTGIELVNTGYECLGHIVLPGGNVAGFVRTYDTDLTKLNVITGGSGDYGSNIITATGYYGFEATAYLA